MDKTLYVSDLDGTLLNKDAEITPFTKDIINRFTSGGGSFTIATARTLDTVLHILEGVRLSAPAVLLNGASVYDMQARRYMKIEAIDNNCLTGLFKTLADFEITGFVYTIENGDIAYYYENLDARHRKAFHDDRSGKYGRVYNRVDSFTDLFDRDIAYFTTCDDRAILSPAYDMLKADPRLRVEFYRDIYHEDFWYMEVCSAAAAKSNAVMYLKKTLGFHRVVSFGDNLNDLPLFRASNVRIAVANAKQEVKAAADYISDTNDNDGVAKWLEENAYLRSKTALQVMPWPCRG